MTDRPSHPPARPAKKRLSRRTLRVIAWVTGGVAFATPWGVLAAHPKPAVAQPQAVQRIIIRRIIRHVYTQAPAKKSAPKVRYVYAPVPAAPAAPAPAPATTSGGSRP